MPEVSDKEAIETIFTNFLNSNNFAFSKLGEVFGDRIMIDNEDFGKIAVELLYDKIQNKNFNPEPIEFPFEYFEGDTVAPPKK